MAAVRHARGTCQSRTLPGNNRNFRNFRGGIQISVVRNPVIRLLQAHGKPPNGNSKYSENHPVHQRNYPVGRIVNSNAGSSAWVTLVTGHPRLERRTTGGFGNRGIARLPAAGCRRVEVGEAWVHVVGMRLAEAARNARNFATEEMIGTGGLPEDNESRCCRQSATRCLHPRRSSRRRFHSCPQLPFNHSSSVRQSSPTSIRMIPQSATIHSAAYDAGLTDLPQLQPSRTDRNHNECQENHKGRQTIRSTGQ